MTLFSVAKVEGPIFMEVLPFCILKNNSNLYNRFMLLSKVLIISMQLLRNEI